MAQKKASRSAKTVIRTAMKACQKKGLYINNGVWGAEYDSAVGYFTPVPEETGVCALGALLIHKNGSVKFKARFGKTDYIEAEDAAAFVLGVDYEWVGVFIEAFDGNEQPETISSLLQFYDYSASHHADVFVGKTAKARELKRAYEMGRDLRKEFGLS